MKDVIEKVPAAGPLANVDEWDDDVRDRYAKDRDESSFRNYDETTPAHVREFYRQNHQFQTVEFARSIRKKYLPLNRGKMTVWEAIEQLSKVIDDSDPDTDLPQIEHALQTAEAIRQDNHPRWFILTGLIHDLGKVLCCHGEPQWAVVGDTFPVGCRFAEAIVLPQFFAENPDASNPEYQSECGIYAPGCGLSEVMMSWGHDEYLYHVIKDHLPVQSQYIIRYHSFYAWHREGAYGHLLNDRDREMLRWVQAFNPYDLYTKSEVRPDVEGLLPFYRELVDEFLPGPLQW
ncbi:MAG: inositol oxygenase [Pirellulales bacterium]|nr:inositol oxygenase [Pirellulales bacterium]